MSSSIDDNGTPDVAGDDFSPTLVSGDTNGNGLLESGEVWLYRAFGTVVSGQYANVGSATGTQGTTPVAAADKAHYRGVTGIRIVKLANGDDANTAPGPVLPIGAPLVYTYQVYGESAVPLAGVLVRDDNGTPGVAGDDFTPRFVERRRERERTARLRRGVAVHLGRRRRRPVDCSKWDDAEHGHRDRDEWGARLGERRRLRHRHGRPC